MSTAFILNPTAGSGKAGRRRDALEAALHAAGMDGQIFETDAPRHAETLAREAAATHDLVVAVGGDGTVQEVARGLLGTEATLGVVPLGTGNDFAFDVGMPYARRPPDPRRHPEVFAAVLEALRDAPTVTVDMGRVRWTDSDGSEGERAFTNCLGIGFDAHAAAATPRYKRLGGTTAYLFGVLEALRSWSQPVVRLDLDGVRTFEGRFLLVEVGNGHSVGGGFLLTPDATLDDGRLDVCAIRAVGRLRILRLLPSTFTAGHTNEPEVSLHRIRMLALEADAPIPLHADGEVLTRAATRVEARVLAGALRVRAPRMYRPAGANLSAGPGSDAPGA